MHLSVELTVDKYRFVTSTQLALNNDLDRLHRCYESGRRIKRLLAAEIFSIANAETNMAVACCLELHFG